MSYMDGVVHDKRIQDGGREVRVQKHNTSSSSCSLKTTNHCVKL
ncbi:hypothetical protein Ccrd_008873, partial [Cynara cardunculus var. scolymus]